MYQPLQISGGLLTLRELAANRIDPYLRDVHAMLHLPMPELGLEAGCNFSIAEILCSVIAGLSRIVVAQEYRPADAFKELLRKYPVNEEPTYAVRAGLPEIAWEIYRCNLVHSLGIRTEWVKPRQAIAQVSSGAKVARCLGSNDHARIIQLECSGQRPEWLPATLSYDGQRHLLTVEALYWGTRRLICDAIAQPESSWKLIAGLEPPNMVGPATSTMQTRVSAETSATATAITSSNYKIDK
jgi:hypothetical protein